MLLVELRSWVTRQLHQHLLSTVRPPSTAALASTPTATPPTAAVGFPAISWTSLAAEPLCWADIMPAALQCMPAQVMLEVVQENLSTAAGSVTGLSRLCDVMTALQACGHADAVVDTVSRKEAMRRPGQARSCAASFAGLMLQAADSNLLKSGLLWLADLHCPSILAGKSLAILRCGP
jgi:hypothetical protein